MPDIITLDTDSAALSSSQWRAYAQQLEEYGTHEPIPREALSDALGDIYSEYIDAKAAEYDARAAAYQRVAAQARAHADKLDNTRNTFTNADEEHAALIEATASS